MENEALIDCECHGKSLAAMVCEHLTVFQDQPAGFIENSNVPDNLQAWCNACEALYNIEESLTEKFKAFNNMSVVCSKCYQDIKRKNLVDISKLIKG
jgi:hypothetical protein